MPIDLKRIAAGEALKFVRRGHTIGFGAGSTMAHMVDLLHGDKSLAGAVTILTSSYTTKCLLENYGFPVRETGSTAGIDLYFDGCDQFDRHLNALKSGGGIHTREKVLASMATRFIIVGDEGKYAEKLGPAYPLVLEVIPEALAFVSARVKDLFNPRECRVRLADKKDGAVITENGNYLVDTWFDLFPDPARIEEELNHIPGLLEHSLFYNLASGAVIAGAGGIRVLERPPMAG